VKELVASNPAGLLTGTWLERLLFQRGPPCPKLTPSHKHPFHN
jgi:hypothetical protein